MEKITISAQHMMEQAPRTVETYLHYAISSIDRLYNEPGYAKAHPELVGAFLRTCGEDLYTSSLIACLQDLQDVIGALAETAEAARTEIGDAVTGIHNTLKDGCINVDTSQ